MAENALGRNQVFAIKNADGTPFHDLVLYKATYDSVVMSLGDKITGDVYYKDNRLDVTMNEYIEFKRDPDDSSEEPVKFVLVSPPTIIKEGIVSENSELKGTTKYSFEFYHPMYKLGNMPLTDIAVTSSEENYLSQNKTFSWCGTGNDFIAKLNANLSYSEWVVVASTNAQSAERLAMMPSDVPTKKAGEQAKSNVLSFDKNTIADGLRTIYETWDIPFVVDTLHQGEYYDINGNDYYSIAGGSKRFVVVVGMPSNEIIDTESEFGTVVEATSVTSNNIYYSPQPINVRKGKKIVLESLTEGATPIILNSSHNGVIGTTSKTFEADMTIYVGLYTKSGLVRYVYDGEEGSIFVFRYGQEVGLKNNSRTPRNNKIITRISASGSEDNIPYGYPQIGWTGESSWNYTINNASGMQTITVGGRTIQAMSYPIYDGIVGGQKVRLIKHPFTRTRLMPTVYVESVNKKVNPNHPLYDPDIELVDYYDADNTYENPIVPLLPSYEIHEFDGIKPELDSNRQIAIQRAIPLNDDLTPADSWVDDLKPDTDEYVQSFFRITLPPLGFDVYACASITQQMQINMRSGACIGCTFEIQVNWDDYKVNFYDSNGNFDPAIGTGHPRDAQKYPNSTSSSINVIVKKETATFGTIMPNIYQQPKSGDLFVILGISLPESYITEAQQRLDNTAKQYMRENNLHYFDYPLKFDEFFLAKHPSILRQIRTNTIVRFDYAGQMLCLCVKQITIKFGEKALPQYNIILTDNIEVVLNPISQIANDVSRISTMAYQNAKQIGSGGGGNVQDKLSKVSDDTANGVIGFLKGLWVGAKKWYFDFNGDISAHDGRFAGYLKVNGDATVNNIGSDNYTGESITDTGWSITSDNGSGSSHAVFDYLTIRKKMIVNSLEIKETHFTAGDIAQSCASAEIARTDYFEVNLQGEYSLLGYSSVKVPWLLRKMAMILGKDNGLVRSMYARHKIVRLTLSEEDLKKVRVVRCYFLAKDGEKSVENWWRVNDLARCQTWNVTQYSRKTFTIDDFNVHGGNVYWWRKVKDVSWNTGLPRYLLADSENNPLDPSVPSNTTTDPDYDYGGKKVYENEAGIKYQVTNGTYHPLDGDDSHAPAVIDGKTYHWFDVEYNYLQEQGGQAHGWCDANSDIPAAGDKVVQFGNSTDPDRMNVTLSEVNGAGNLDAPDIKIFRGIYTFSLEESWWGGVPCKMKLSPATGYDFYGPHFRFTTEYGTARVPIDRPEKYWLNIDFEPDEYWSSKPGYVAPDYSDDIYSQGQFVTRGDGHSPKNYVRKCRYYDRVSHNGSLWLCSMANESWYWRATANIPGTAYSEGDVVTNYASLTDVQKAYCEHVRNYTNQEPTPASSDWTKQVDKGENSVRIALDNEHEDFLYSKSGLVAPANGATSQATLYDGSNPVAANNVTWKVSLDGGTTYNNSGSSAQSGSEANGWISDAGLLTVTGINVDSADVYVKAIYPRVNGEEYIAKFTANKTEQDKFDIVIRPNAISFNSSDVWTDKDIKISANCTSLNGGFTENYTLKDSAANGLRLYYAYVSSNGTIGTLAQVTSGLDNVTFDSTNNRFTFVLGQTTANSNVGVYFELRYYTDSSTYRMCDYETVEFAKTVNGSNVPYIEFSRNAIMYDADNSGYAVGTQEFQLTYTLKVGGNVCTVPDASYILISTPTGASIKSGTKTTYGCTFVVADGAMPSGSISVVITGTYDRVNYTATSSVAIEPNKKGDTGDDSVVYSLECSPDVVNFRSNAVGDIPSTSQTVTIAMKKTVGNNAPQIVTDKYLHYRKYGLASQSASAPSWGSWTRITNGQYSVSSTDALNGTIMEVEFCISSVTSGVSDSNVLCRKTVPVLLDGKKGAEGNTGRMFYSAGEWSSSVTYQRTDDFVPMVYYNDDVWNPNLEMFGDYYYLNAESAGGSDVPGASSKWVLCNDYTVVITQALFASFAKLGGFIVSGDFFFSQYGTLVSFATTYDVLSPLDISKSYKLGPNNSIQDSPSGGNDYRKAYTYFDATDPMAENVLSGDLKFRPALCINSVTGETHMAQGNFRVDASGNVDIDGTVRTKLFYAATKTVTSDNYEIDLDDDPYYTYFKEPGSTNYRVKLPDPADYEGVELRFFSPIAPGGSSQNVMRVYWPDGTINLCLDTGISEVTAVALKPFRMGTLKVIHGEWWTIDDSFVAAVV